MEKQIYQPISCNFYDELEALATLKKSCQISYKDINDKILTISGVISDFFIKDKIEFLQLKNGQTIRLDYLIEVDGKPLKGYC